MAGALEHNGDLYSCDHYVYPGHKLGNIMETPLAELMASVTQRRFGSAKRDSLPECCKICEVRLPAMVIAPSTDLQKPRTAGRG